MMPSIGFLGVDRFFHACESLAVLVVSDEIGEGAPDVDAQTVTHALGFSSSILFRRQMQRPHSRPASRASPRRAWPRRSLVFVEIGPGRSLPMIRPSMRHAGITPPAVVARNISSASRSLAGGDLADLDGNAEVSRRSRSRICA